MMAPFFDSDAFITVWDTRNVREPKERRSPLFKGIHDRRREQSAAPTGDRHIELPIEGGAYTVYWMRLEDPTQRGQQSGEGTFVLDLPAPGVYRLSIVGDIENIIFYDYGDADKLIDIEQWGTTRWMTMERAFQGARNLDISASDTPDLSMVHSTMSMFEGAESFNAPLNDWDVSAVVHMRTMFKDASAFNQDLDEWDTRSLEVVEFMFSEATAFNGAVEGWDMRGVRSTAGMFQEAASFNQPVNAWDVSAVRDMPYMFKGATAFNQELDQWNVRLVELFDYFLADATSFNSSMAGWDLVCAYDMTAMFKNARSFNQPLDSWQLYDGPYSIDTMESMFEDATAFNQPLNGWEIPASVDVTDMFRGADAFEQDLSDWEADPTSPKSDESSSTSSEWQV